jgi:H+/Cl- antiporter ClcA
MLNLNFKYDISVMVVYFIIWYIFTIVTSGTALPIGIFLPCIIIGSALG